MDTMQFGSNEERDRYLEIHYKDRKETVTPYVFDVKGGTISVYDKTIVFEPREKG